MSDESGPIADLRARLAEGFCLCSSAHTDWRGVEDLLDRLAAAEGVVARVEALLREDRKHRDEHALMSECGCSYKDCYECGKWCRCIHTPYAAIRAALAPAPTDDVAGAQRGGEGA